MSDDAADTPDMLAAEYVLGTLARNEREQAETLIANDPEFARLVAAWERRLGQLHAMVAPVEPPPETWARIEARVAGVEPSATMLLPHPDHAARVAAESNVVDIRRRLGRWRRASVGLGAVAAALLALVVTSVMRPDALPGALRPKPIEIVRIVEKPVDAGRFVAVLQQDSASPAFILTVDVATRTASVRRVAAAPQAGKSYQLWLVSDRFAKPQALGLVGSEEFARPTLARYDAAVISGATYAVSLEPEGGAPHPEDGPSGPVLFTARLVEAVPSSR
jgi:anti-sigma-K factor RskA